MAVPSYYTLGFDKALTQRTKEAQATIGRWHAIVSGINTACS